MHLEMQMRIGRVRVAGVADEPEHFSCARRDGCPSRALCSRPGARSRTRCQARRGARASTRRRGSSRRRRPCRRRPRPPEYRAWRTGRRRGASRPVRRCDRRRSCRPRRMSPKSGKSYARRPSGGVARSGWCVGWKPRRTCFTSASAFAAGCGFGCAGGAATVVVSSRSSWRGFRLRLRLRFRLRLGRDRGRLGRRRGLAVGAHPADQECRAGRERRRVRSSGGATAPRATSEAPARRRHRH